MQNWPCYNGCARALGEIPGKPRADASWEGICAASAWLILWHIKGAQWHPWIGLPHLALFTPGLVLVLLLKNLLCLNFQHWPLQTQCSEALFFNSPPCPEPTLPVLGLGISAPDVVPCWKQGLSPRSLKRALILPQCSLCPCFTWFLDEWPVHTWVKRCQLYLMLVLVLLPPAFTCEDAVLQQRCTGRNMEDLCPLLKLLGFLQ